MIQMCCYPHGVLRRLLEGGSEASGPMLISSRLVVMRWPSLITRILKGNVVMSLRHDNLKLLFDTDGDKGCRYFTENFKGRLNGIPMKTLDTSGAGDVTLEHFWSQWRKIPTLLLMTKRNLGRLCYLPLLVV